MVRTITVDVEVEEVLDALSDDDVLREYAARGLSKKDEPDAREIVSRALAIIRTGRVEDGLTLLEREFLPKWQDREEADKAYRQAMSLKVAA